MMREEKIIKVKKNIIIKKFFKTITLGLIVFFFFIVKIPFFVLKIIYNFFSLKCNKKVYEILYDNHNYDYRVWYLQYIDKGFSFMFTSSTKLEIPENYTYKNESKKINIPFKWYLEIQFRRIFLLQKYLFFNLLFHLLFMLFEKKYLKLYFYTFLTILRLIFGEFIIKNIDNKKKKIINIFVILLKKLFDEDEILKEIKNDYNWKKKIKFYFNKILYKIKFYFLFYIKSFNIFFIKYLLLNAFKVYMKIVYIFKLSYMIYDKFFKYMKPKKTTKDTKKTIKDTKKDFTLLYIYKPNMLNFYIKNSDESNLYDKLSNIFNPNNIKSKGKNYYKIKKNLINKEWIFKYKIYQIRWKLNFLNAKNMSLQAFSNIKTYSDWIIYKYRFIEKIVFKKIMKQLIWSKTFESSFSLDVEWDLFLLGDNIIYGLLENHKFMWEEPSKKYSEWLYEIYFNWSLIKLPYRDFIDSFLKKSMLNWFMNRHVWKVNKWTMDFSNDIFIYMNKNFYQKDIIALLYDNYYYYMISSFENYNNKNLSLQKKILEYLKKDFEALKINFEDLKFIFEIKEIEKKIIDTKTKKQKEMKKTIKNIIKENVFKFSSYYENAFFMFRWIKFYGLKWFDLELYDQKIFKISKTMSKNLINGNFYFNNIWFESFNVKLFKKLQSNYIYKLLKKKNGIMPFFFFNENLRNKWIIWSSNLSNKFDWVSKKRPLKFFKKLKKANLEKKLNVFAFCINIWKYLYIKIFKLRNLKALTFILGEWKKIYLKTPKKKKQSKI